MKIITRIIPLLFLALFLSHAFQSESVANKMQESLVNRSLGNVNFKQSNVPLLLSEIAYKYNIPIGIEVSPDDDLLKDRNIIVQINGGTLKDVLDTIIKQNSLYSWDIEDGVVNVFPRSNREPLLTAILEAQIESFSIEKKTGRFKFREELTERPEVKNILDAYGVTADNQVYIMRDVMPLGKSFSLNVSNMKVKLILNRVIKESETKCWIINRDGDRKQYLLLNL